jgi:hypothetical protein
VPSRVRALFFRRDTWHHGFSYGGTALRVLELFAPPPSTGSSGAYARTRPYLRESLYAPDQRPDDGVGASDTPSLRLLRAGEATWRLDRGILVGLLVRTEHLTAGIQDRSTLDLPNSRSRWELYVMDADGRHERRLTTRRGLPLDQSWSPGGRMILFETAVKGGGLFVINSDGTGLIRLGQATADRQRLAYVRGPRLAL